MSFGLLQQIVDRHGVAAKSLDVVINPEVASKLSGSQDKDYLQFFFELLQNYIHQKFHLSLVNWFTRLTKCSYKGSYVQFHRVKYKESPKIKVVSEEVTNKKLKREDVQTRKEVCEKAEIKVL